MAVAALPQRPADLPGDPQAPLSPSAAEGLVRLLKPLRCPARSFVAVAGAPANELGLVDAGVFRLLYIDAEGRELTKQFFAEGSWLLTGLDPGLPALASVQAITPGRLRLAPLAAVEALMRGHPDLLWWFNRRLLDHLAAKQRREIALLNQRALTRYAAFRAQEPDLEGRVPLHMVASHLGMTATQLSRVRRRLGRD